jgi:cell division protein FtsL
MSRVLRRRRLVKERDPRSVRQLGVLFCMCAGAGALFLFSLWQRVELTGLRYRMMELRNERDALLETHENLRLERSELRSLPRVEILARQRLGLEPAEPPRVFTVNESGELIATGMLPTAPRRR